jgi:hypothetical protein
MSTFPDLRAHLAERLSLLQGDWVADKNAYEGAICGALEMEMEQQANRYWDARWGGHLIEFKKGKSIWIDLVRYAEVLLRANEAACQKTLTLFFIPNLRRDAIEKVLCVETQTLIRKMGLTESDAKSLLGIHERLPRSLNAQARLTVTDVRGLACFSVP